MKREVQIDDLVYVLEFSGSDFSFYLDYEKSNIPSKPRYAEFDEDTVREYDLYEVDQKTVFRLKKSMLEFIKSALLVEKPYYFKFSAFNERKMAIYEKLAEQLAYQNGYHLLIEGRVFRFYRI